LRRALVAVAQHSAVNPRSNGRWISSADSQLSVFVLLSRAKPLTDPHMYQVRDRWRLTILRGLAGLHTVCYVGGAEQLPPSGQLVEGPCFDQVLQGSARNAQHACHLLHGVENHFFVFNPISTKRRMACPRVNPSFLAQASSCKTVVSGSLALTAGSTPVAGLPRPLFLFTDIDPLIISVYRNRRTKQVRKHLPGPNHVTSVEGHNG
jgi:hypothetical protein